jgi:hypothetical protein
MLAADCIPGRASIALFIAHHSVGQTRRNQPVILTVSNLVCRPGNCSIVDACITRVRPPITNFADQASLRCSPWMVFAIGTPASSTSSIIALFSIGIVSFVFVTQLTLIRIHRMRHYTICYARNFTRLIFITHLCCKIPKAGLTFFPIAPFGALVLFAQLCRREIFEI